MELCTLTEDDAAEYQGLRLRSLQEHPEAFDAFVEGKMYVCSEARGQGAGTRLLHETIVMRGMKLSLKT